jgi:hypothetical protein
MDKKKFVRSVILFLILYALLMVPWPGLQAAYSKFYRCAASLVFDSFGSGGAVRFHPADHPQYNVMTIAFYDLRNPPPDGRVQPFHVFNISSRYSAYIYVAFVVALILATPIPLRRKGWAILWGLISIHAYLALKTAILVNYVFLTTPRSPVTFSPVMGRALFFAQNLFMKQMVFSFMVCVFIWFSVSFFRWPRFIRKKSDSDGGQ